MTVWVNRLSQLHSHSLLIDILPMSNISLDIEFAGGLELLFSNQRRHRVELPFEVPVDNSTDEGSLTATKNVDLAFLVVYLRDRLLKERPELFVEKDTV